MPAPYEGSCHCGAVRFRIAVEPVELTTCDCSLCTKKNAVMAAVHERGFALLAGEEALSLYQWNTGVARHHFCSRCGIYTFHCKRSAPDHYGVNVFCLEGFDVAAFPRRAAVGRDMTVTPGASDRFPGPLGS
ncbi:MAG TPA: GFA family protein [Caulobacteraceae bacterium]